MGVRRKKRDSSPTERVAKAAKNGGHVEFDYDETTEVLQAALQRVTNGAHAQRRKLRRATRKLDKISVPPPKDEGDEGL